VQWLTLGIAFPTSISPNNTVAHLSPLPTDPESTVSLSAGDIVKISLGAHIDGFAGILADTLVVPNSETADDVVTGRRADVLMAGWLASEAAVRLVKPGAKNYGVTEAVGKIAEAFGCKPCEGTTSPLPARSPVRVLCMSSLMLALRLVVLCVDVGVLLVLLVCGC